MGLPATATAAELAKEAFPLCSRTATRSPCWSRRRGSPRRPLQRSPTERLLPRLPRPPLRPVPHHRYDPTYPEALKLVLLHVETDLNTTVLILPDTAVGHDEAVFRARVITTYHVFNALAQADAAHPQAASPHVARLRVLLGSPEGQRLNSAHGGRSATGACTTRSRARSAPSTPVCP